MDKKLKGISLRRNNKKLSDELIKELRELESTETEEKPNQTVWTIDTSSFLTIICC